MFTSTNALAQHRIEGFKWDLQFSPRSTERKSHRKVEGNERKWDHTKMKLDAIKTTVG